MKYPLFLNVLALSLALPSGPLFSAITLNSLGTGTKGGAASSDTTPLQINVSGNAVDPNAGSGFEDFAVTGSATQAAAFDTDFTITLDAVSVVDESIGRNLGSKTTDGNIDRSGSGDLGVLGTTNGIDASEGFLVGLDASNLDSGSTFQITAVEFSGINGVENGAIVNRNNPVNKRLTFGASGTGADVELSAGAVDVTCLDLLVDGGLSNAELLSVFADATSLGNFRIVGFQLEVVESSAITLDSIDGGDEGSTLFIDNTILSIDATGAVSVDVADPDYLLTGGSVIQDFAFNSDFTVILQGMSDVDEIPGTRDFGAKLVDGGIDRASTGDLGVVGGVSGGGIDPGEGLLFGIDATNLDASLAYQIVGIEFAFADNDNVTVVNRNDPFNAVLSLSGGFSGWVDVSALGLAVSGGELDDEIVSIFAESASPGALRINGLKIKVVNSGGNILSLDSLGSGSEGDVVFSDTTPLSIDNCGDLVDPNAGGGFEDFAVSGNVSQDAALNTDFSITIQGMSSVRDDAGTGNDLGEKLADGGIDRSGGGDFGIRGGENAGINALEGFLVGLDATSLDSGLAFQITSVEFSAVNGAESGTIVNRSDTSKTLSFSSSGLIDVRCLDLFVLGGANDSEVVSIFADDFGTGNFRIVGFQVQVVGSPSSNPLTLDSLGSGSEGDTGFSDTTALEFDASGMFAGGESDFGLSGSANQSFAFGTSFSITIQGMSDVDQTIGTAFGAKIADGGIDRSGAGDIGIRSGSNFGIEPDEGLLVGLDATNLHPSLAFQITGIQFSAASGDDATVVNRGDTTRTLTLSGDFNGMADVSFLGLIVDGGTIDLEMVSIFCTSNGFRVAGLELKVINSPSSGLFTFDSLPTGSQSNTRFVDTTEMLIDICGNVVDPNAATGFDDFAVAGSITQTAANDSTFFFTVQGMGNVDQTDGPTLGALVTAGGIDRDGSGNLGIRLGNSDGIDPDEGYLVGIDATELAPSLSFQITAIEFATAASDNATVVNRSDTSKRSDLTGNFNGLVDVTSLDLIIQGGIRDDEMVSIFNTDGAANGFKIASFVLAVVTTPTPSVDLIDQFRIDNGLAANGDDDALTPAGDGVENILKYAFNMIGFGVNQEPTLNTSNIGVVSASGEAGLPLIEVNGSGFLEVTYIRRKAASNPSITYAVVFTDNLTIGFAENASAVEATPVSIDEDFERVTVTDSESTSTASKRFGRVELTLE